MGPYFAPQSSKNENGFEYPDPESFFDVRGEHQTQMSEYSVSASQDCHPSPSHQVMYQATTSIAEHPRSSSDPWHEEPDHGQVTPVLPSTITPSSYLDIPLQHKKKANPGFVPYPAGRQQAPRGTTGNIICADCGGKFTVRSSLNRHSKICRGRKKPKRPASTQHQNVRAPEDRSVHPSAADEHDSVPSEGVSGATGFNSDFYNMPTKRTRSASHDTDDVILANKLSNYNSLTAESKWYPPEQQDHAEALDSSFNTVSATNTSFCPSNTQNPIPTSGSFAPSPYSQKVSGTPSYVSQSRDTSADHNPFFCDECYTIFPSRDLLQLHTASAHGLTEKR